jgi:hypothetical protein
MAVFFLLLAVLLGVVLGDALVENESTGAITLFGQSTDQFTDGQLLLGFAGLGILFALLLVLSVSSTRRRRARRKERRTASRELEDRATELERDNARLRSDLAQQEEALAGREAELAHRDRQLALKDEELARLGAVPGSEQEAARGEGATARREPETAQRADDLPRRGEEPVSDAPAAPTEVQGRPVVAGSASPAGGAASSGPILSPDAEPVAPLHDEPPWQAARADDPTRSAQGSGAAGDRAGQAGGDTPTEHPTAGQTSAAGSPVDRRTEPESSATEDPADAGDDDRTRPMQRPDKNA